jgi:ABC-type glycerol-3-phosphate transport system substrate-binding protein
MSKFQLTLLIVFGAFIMIAVLVFSLYRGSAGSASHITIWGPMPASDFTRLVNDAKLNSKTLSITYIEKSEGTLDRDYTEALARGTGPDLVILPHSLVYKTRQKLMQIPYASVSRGDYENTFIDEGDIFLDANGIYALPFAIDPLVMYWNKATFSSAGLAKPIGYWDELYAATEKLTVKDSAGNITKSAMALGETKNIPHAKDILTLLMLQAGSPIAVNEPYGLVSHLASNENLPINPAGAAIDFYTQFSNSSKPFYSWNRSLLPAQNSFAVGDSAMYIGFASELKSIRAKSPTLNIGVAPVPQSRTSGSSISFGKLYGIAISKSTTDAKGALNAALLLISNSTQSVWTGITGLPPVRRDLLSIKQNDSAMQVFYTAAIQAKGWLDPDGSATQKVFTDTINAVTSGRSRTTEAVFDANTALQAVIDNTK